MLERTQMAQLLSWKAEVGHKPLYVDGIKGCGKSFLVKEFGTRCYERCVQLSFKLSRLTGMFKKSQTFEELLRNLNYITGSKIVKEGTVLIFDDVDLCPHALDLWNSFAGEAKGYDAVFIGSLLPFEFDAGVLDNFERITIVPLTFDEFLKASDKDYLLEFKGSLSLQRVPEQGYLDLIKEELKSYLIIGGLPEAVNLWNKSFVIGDILQMQKSTLGTVKDQLLRAAGRKMAGKSNELWEVIPKELKHDHKKFYFTHIKAQARLREYEKSLDFILRSGLFSLLPRCKSTTGHDDLRSDAASFKVYGEDIGLIFTLMNTDPACFAAGDLLFELDFGALCENLAYLELKQALPDFKLSYWSELNPFREVQFVAQNEEYILPILLCCSDLKVRSLRKFYEYYQDRCLLMICVNTNRLSFEDGILYIPVYLIADIKRYIDEALSIMGTKQAA